MEGRTEPLRERQDQKLQTCSFSGRDHRKTYLWWMEGWGRTGRWGGNWLRSLKEDKTDELTVSRTQVCKKRDKVPELLFLMETSSSVSPADRLDFWTKTKDGGGHMTAPSRVRRTVPTFLARIFLLFLSSSERWWD